MKTKRRILLAIVSLCLILSMMPLLPVAADGAQTTTPDTDVWTGTKSMEWIGAANAFAASDSNTNTTACSVTIEKPKSEDSDENETCAYYKVTDYEEGTTFIIDSAADLAGLAALVNVENHKDKGWFYNCTFIITKNLDLANIAWSPIGLSNDQDFCGTIIGALNDNAGQNNVSITIRNMNMTSNNNMGLVSTQCTGGIQNITIEDSTLKNTTKNATGSFVGYVRETTFTYNDVSTKPAAPVYKNLKSTAKIVGEKAEVVAGGIIANSKRSDLVIENCEFGGEIDNVGAKSGGIIGYAQLNITIKSCKVNNATIKASHYNDCLVAGVVAHADKDITVTGCTVNATLTNSGVGRTGGIIGFVNTGATTNISDCIVKGTINSPYAFYDDPSGTNDKTRGGVAGVIGFQRGTATITNVVVLSDITGADRNGTAGIVGLHDENNTISLTIKKCYVDGTKITGTNVGGFVGESKKTITIEDCQIESELTGTLEGLAVGNYTGTALTLTRCVSTTQTGAWQAGTGTAAATTTCYDSTTYKAATLGDAWTTFNGNTALRVAAPYLMNVDSTAVDADSIKIVGLQKHSTDTSKVRLIAEINGKAYKAAGFDIHLAKFVDEADTAYSKVISKDVDVCYTSYIDGEGGTVTAKEGSFFVIIELTGLENYNELTVTYSAYVKDAQDTKAYATAAPAQVCLLQS